MLHSFIIPLFLSVFFKSCATLDKNVAEDAFLTTPELISKYGYPAETHNVITKDGYILKIHRIPQGKKNRGKIVDSKKVVLITHGILGSSADFIIIGPDKALPYFLADSGYDVWLLNCRGNRYSRNHTSLSPKSRKFWNFSWHEMAIYDLPNTIDYILQATNNKNLAYIGHSQGSTILFVLSSIIPEYNEKIRLSIHLAPIAFMSHLKSRLVRVVAFNRFLLASLKLLGLNDILPASKTRTRITNAVCADGSFTQPICMQILFSFGKNYPQLNRTILPEIFGHFPSGGSVKQIQHYAQEAVSGHFRQFDHGLIKNKLIYKKISPPDYNLTNVLAPVVLFTSGNDPLSDLKDVDNLVKRLPNLKQYVRVADLKFTHTDYLYANEAKEIVYKPILQIIESST